MNVLYEKEIRIERLPLGQWDSNCYVVSCAPRGDTVIIDTPAEPEKILKAVQGLAVKLVLITHGHSDHLGALPEIKAALGVPVAVHPHDAPRLSPPADMMLSHGQEIALGGQTLKVLHTPGHTPGSLCFLLGKHLLAGDTIFPNGPGKTNRPQDFEQILESITRQIFVLPDDTVVYPGHGFSTVLGKEKGLFAQFNSRPRKPGLCGDVVWAP